MNLASIIEGSLILFGSVGLIIIAVSYAAYKIKQKQQ